MDKGSPLARADRGSKDPSVQAFHCQAGLDNSDGLGPLLATIPIERTHRHLEGILVGSPLVCLVSEAIWVLSDSNCTIYTLHPPRLPGQGCALQEIMAGPLLSGDKQTSRRRWVIAGVIFTLILLLFSATTHYRPLRPQGVDHPPPPPPSLPPQAADHTTPPPDPAKTVASPQFTKPKDVPIVGFIFFGRKSRVEILRCYIEVRSVSVAYALPQC
jgi:hypothetical protein